MTLRRLIAPTLALALTAGAADARPSRLAPAVEAAQPAAGARPDTPAVRLITAYIKAMNANSDEALRRFEEANRSPAALAARPMDDRLKQAAELRARWGTLTLRRVAESTPTSQTVLIDTAREGTLEFTFDFDPAHPDKILGIRIGGPVDPDEAPLTADDRRQTIDALARALNEGYVFPETAEKMAAMLERNLGAGAYDDATSARALAQRLTVDLRAISQDKHLSVVPTPRRAAEAGESAPNPMANLGADNFGFKKVEILPGNVGYVRLDGFFDGEDAQTAAAAALAFVRHADALVFDLRFNGGGSPEQIRFISSYLFDQPTHLNSFYDRLGNKTEEYWTLAEIPGERFAPDLPVYVLTSTYTFSGAEEFSYNLKNLGRATIVGETTGGGAHPVTGVRLNDRFIARVPFARAHNPITKTNWEGVGVAPDIDVPAPEALDRALAEIAANNTRRARTRADR